MGLFNIKIRVTISDIRYEDLPPTGVEDRFDNLMSEHMRGEVNLLLPFIPQVGMHFGESQFLSVCQVYWIEKTSFIIDTRHLECVSYNASMAVALANPQRKNFYDKDDSPITRWYADVRAAMLEVESAFNWKNASAYDDEWRWEPIIEEEY